MCRGWVRVRNHFAKLSYFTSFAMTGKTNRNDIKLMFGRITVPMMVFFSLIGTVVALQSIRTGQVADSDGILNGFNCLSLSWKPSSTLISRAASVCLTNITLSIGFSDRLSSFSATIFRTTLSIEFFVFLGLLRYFTTNYTFALIAIFSCSILMKFRNRFGLLANTSGFGYDGLRHSRLLNRRLCLEPVAGTYQRSACLIIT